MAVLIEKLDPLIAPMPHATYGGQADSVVNLNW